MLDNFIATEILTTFTGLVLAVSIIVQFTKDIVKSKYGDKSVRLYAFTVSLLLCFTFVGDLKSVQGIVVTTINSVIVTLASVGGYEIVADPRAEKTK